jgi:hypothetical protein
MPRFFFHLKDRRYLIRDNEGEELQDRAAARRFALESARDLMGNDSVGDWIGCAYEIADQSSKKIGIVLFSEAVAGASDDLSHWAKLSDAQGQRRQNLPRLALAMLQRWLGSLGADFRKRDGPGHAGQLAAWIRRRRPVFGSERR